MGLLLGEALAATLQDFRALLRVKAATWQYDGDDSMLRDPGFKRMDNFSSISGT